MSHIVRGNKPTYSELVSGFPCGTIFETSNAYWLRAKYNAICLGSKPNAKSKWEAGESSSFEDFNFSDYVSAQKSLTVTISNN